MTVCLSASISKKVTRPNFTKFSLNVACDCGMVILKQRCYMLRISGFENRVMFVHNGHV